MRFVNRFNQQKLLGGDQQIGHHENKLRKTSYEIKQVAKTCFPRPSENPGSGENKNKLRKTSYKKRSLQLLVYFFCNPKSKSKKLTELP